MKNRRLEDQALILEAIFCVRKELNGRAARGQGDFQIGPVMVRLTTLYSLLDVKRLEEIVKAADKRQEFDEGKKSA